ncbi:MAG: carboxylate--amine ligase, partial [Halobacteriaceae archaeon]
ATFISPDGTQTKSLDQVVETVSDRLNLDVIRQLLNEESGAALQRRICKDEGPQALADALVL